MKHLSALLLSFLCLTTLAQSPAAAAKPAPQAKPIPDGIDHITLGQSVFPLNGPWKFSIGDSPIDPATHQPLWAEPGFDDSHWEDVDLTPARGLLRSHGRPLRLRPRLDRQGPSRILRLRLVPHSG